MWSINSSKEEIVLSRDSKELFVQRFVKIFQQNWKHMEAQNQRTGTPADFTAPWCGTVLSEAATAGVV